jgi:hypothetical protein
MYSAEQAYEEIAKGALDFLKGREWDKVVCEVKIYSQMAEIKHYFVKNGVQTKTALGWGNSNIKNGEAAIFLRDDLLKTTGHRAWGLTYTLLPTGKMNIEYSYDKPKGYEED